MELRTPQHADNITLKMSRLNINTNINTPARDAPSIDSESEGYLAFFARITRSFITSPRMLVQYGLGGDTSPQPITPSSTGVADQVVAASGARSAPPAVFSPAPHAINAIAPVAAESVPPTVPMTVRVQLEPPDALDAESELGGGGVSAIAEREAAGAHSCS